MKIIVNKLIELSEQNVDDIFLTRLNQLREGRWIEGKYVMEEFYTSHKFDSSIGKVTDPKLAICVAAIRLQNLLEKEDKKNVNKK